MTEQFDRLTSALADRYRIERELGAGGMATVYLAEDLKHQRKVAVKVLRPELAAMLGKERFLKEISVTANLQHPHILPLFDSGNSDDFLYYVMPLVEGEALADTLRREGQLPIEKSVDIARQVAAALEYAHARGVVHRDIKPDNIMLSSGEAIVADFGIARAIDVAGGDQLTATGAAIGTPAYMSPEQAAGDREIDARSDVYALGCVLYEMIAGEPPFTGNSVQALIAKRLTEPAPNISALRENVPPPLSVALAKALARAPVDRFESAGAFAAALTTSQTISIEAAGDPSLLAFATLGLVTAGFMVMRTLGIGPVGTLMAKGVLEARDPILLAEFDNRTTDPTLGETITGGIRIDLSQSNVVRLVEPATVTAALERMVMRPDVRLDEGLARQVAEREGIKAVIVGEVSAVGSGYMLSARLVSPADGALLGADRVAAAGDTELISAIDRLSARLRERIGESLKDVRVSPRCSVRRAAGCSHSIRCLARFSGRTI